MIIGYGRTSTFDQTASLAAQERDLVAAGATKLFTKQVSSVAQRAKLTECLAFLREGDVLMVTKPDRLARSTAEVAGDRGGPIQAWRRLSGPEHGWRTPGYPQSNIEADADDPGRCGDLGTRDHAGASTRGHCQSQG